MRFSLAALLVFFVLLTGLSAAHAETEGLAYTEDTVFTVGDGEVHVVTDAVMSNTTAERRRGNTIYYTYFDQFIVVVPKDAVSLKIESGGRVLTSATEELDADFDVHSTPLPVRLRSGQSRSFVVSYTLPKGEIRGEGLFFSNPAFHAFPVWSFSDSGTGSLLLRIPEEAEVGESSDVLILTEIVDGYSEWVPKNFDVPAEVFTVVTVTIDEALTKDTFRVAGQDIELRIWPGDKEWAEFAKNTISQGFPTLETLIGLPVPEQSTLEVTESVTPYFYGYAGWYNRADTSIEVGNELDETVMLHELSHAWFNDELFDERWVAEGLAEEFTWRAQEELGWTSEWLPSTPRSADRGAQPLLSWGDVNIFGATDEEIRDSEVFGYAASWFTIHEIVETIGVDGMQRVIEAADAHTTSYPGENPSEVTNKPDDWRRLLDLVSHAASVEDEPGLDQLFIDYVIGESHVAELEDRRAARDSYQEFLASDLDWRVPAGVRHAMTLWNFDVADAMMTKALEVQDRQREVALLAADSRLQVSNAARAVYERDEPDFDQALAALDRQGAAIPGVEALRAAALRPLTTEERWGLGNLDLQPYVQHGEVAYGIDDFEAITNAHLGLDDVRLRAEAIGANRLKWSKIGGGASSAVAVLLVWMMLRRWRGSRAKCQHELVLAA
ncbi:MAG: hypothetical protein ACI81L_001378 [Verrucomicrobiales bacterium]|jgi:hypothetical protein